MSSYSIDIKGYNELLKTFSTLDNSSKNVLRTELKSAIQEVEYTIRRDVPVDQARLKNSITSKVNGDLSAEVTASASYAPYVEFGTKRKARVPSEIKNFASGFQGPSGVSETDPLVALTAWVKRKGFAANYSIKSKKRTSRSKGEAKLEKNIAFLIFRKIKKEGIRPQPFFFSDKSGTVRLEKIKELVTQRLLKGIELVLR